MDVNIDLTKVKTKKAKPLEAHPLITAKDCTDLFDTCNEYRRSGKKETEVKIALNENVHPWLALQIGIIYRSRIQPQDYDLVAPNLIKQHEDWMKLHPNNGPIPQHSKKKKQCYDCGTELVFWCPRCKTTKS